MTHQTRGLLPVVTNTPAQAALRFKSQKKTSGSFSELFIWQGTKGEVSSSLIFLLVVVEWGESGR